MGNTLFTGYTISQTFDTVEHYERIAQFVVSANQQNRERLAAEVQRAKSPA